MQTYLIGDNSRSVPNAARLVRDFMEGFEQEFGRASQDERKVMIQKCIAGIVIDREALVARFRVRRIPAVTPEMEKALKSDGNEGLVVSCQCARTRNLNQSHTPIGSLSCDYELMSLLSQWGVKPGISALP